MDVAFLRNVLRRSRGGRHRGAEVIDMAAPSAVFRHAGGTVLFSSVLPMTAFYLALDAFGLNAAICAALAWYYGGVAVRLARRRPVVGAMLLGAGLMTIRAVVAIWTGSAFVFFLQPVAGTVATATSFALTALAGRPLAERLAHDFVPVPPELTTGCTRAASSTTRPSCGGSCTGSTRPAPSGCSSTRP